MWFAAVWVPRSTVHINELRGILKDAKLSESVENFSSISFQSTDRIREVEEENDGTGRRQDVVEFSVISSGEELQCVYTQVGMLVAAGENKEDLVEKTELLYEEIARHKWDVLAEQLAEDHIPFGKTFQEMEELDIPKMYEEVCTNYLGSCARRTRRYSRGTRNEEITDLLQRVKQAEACHKYMTEVYDIERPDLDQYISYTRNLMEMRHQNINIKSQRHREKQLKRIEVIAVIFTVATVLLSAYDTFGLNLL